ncbi:MAG: hypothetical protein KBT87_14555 [Gammaproteobacteria bacterium]|jgi:hypothetical protein|nr:hypothetical protein [Gammaproteobacteria bacterium]
MKNFLKDNLPKQYKKSKVTKGAFEYEYKGIIGGVRLEKSDFLDGEDKWVFFLNVSVHDRYWCHDSQDAALVVLEGAVLDGQIILLERWDQITHWELDDLDGLKAALSGIVLPWLEWFTEPKQLIEYLNALEVLEADSSSSKALAKYGSVLADKLELSPPRARKYYNGAIASLYNELGEYELALKHLEKHREFRIHDHRPSEVEEFNESHRQTLELIDRGINDLHKQLRSGK